MRNSLNRGLGCGRTKSHTKINMLLMLKLGFKFFLPGLRKAAKFRFVNRKRIFCAMIPAKRFCVCFPPRFRRRMAPQKPRRTHPRRSNCGPGGTPGRRGWARSRGTPPRCSTAARAWRRSRAGAAGAAHNDRTPRGSPEGRKHRARILNPDKNTVLGF